jgi:mannosyl-oligosaccharide alpha-1,2-mannosidase
MPAFEHPEARRRGLPFPFVNLRTGRVGRGWTGGSALLAEWGTVQVELRHLSTLTGDPRYREACERPFAGVLGRAALTLDRVDDGTGMAVEHAAASQFPKEPNDGLWPIWWDRKSGQPSRADVSFGAMGDSFFEYLLKSWLQTGKTQQKWREMYDRAMDGMVDALLVRAAGPSSLPEAERLWVVAEKKGRNGRIERTMEHLVCFLPALLALGAVESDGADPDRDLRDMRTAKALAYTCWQMYEAQPSGLGAERTRYGGNAGGRDGAPQAPDGSEFYILRPEAAEALYLVHAATRHPMLREWAWKIFRAIESRLKTQHGYGSWPDVRREEGTIEDRMESFFLAETLKYLWLIQADASALRLDRVVLNTEAHPMKREAAIRAGLEMVGA